MRPSAQLHLLEELKEDAHSPPHRLVIDHGTAFAPAPLPPDVEPGEQGCCFYNAFTLASRQPDRYTYFEGFATYQVATVESHEWSWPLTHAWCIENARVVDPTWEPLALRPLAYRGVALPM
jgi:hypothetical protein